MNNKMRSKKLTIIILAVVAFGIFGLTILRAFFYAPSDEVPLSDVAIKQLSIQRNNATSDKSKIIYASPSRLNIPKLNINANIQKVGITKKGNMGTPNNFTDVGWYKYGTIPGNMGSAVIAGHVDNGVGLPAVFNRLNKLNPGDDIYITTETDVSLHFKVTESSIYDFNAKAEEVFFQKDGKYLKLITCTGTFIRDYGTRDKRLVVSAVLVENKIQ